MYDEELVNVQKAHEHVLVAVPVGGRGGRFCSCLGGATSPTNGDGRAAAPQLLLVLPSHPLYISTFVNNICLFALI